MKTIKLKDRDLVPEAIVKSDVNYDDGVYLYGLDTIAQRVSNTLKLFAGEWFLNPNEGVPWIPLLDKPFSLRQLSSELRKIVLKDEEVDNIQNIEINPDFARRTLQIKLTVSAGPDTINITEEIK